MRVRIKAVVTVSPWTGDLYAAGPLGPSERGSTEHWPNCPQPCDQRLALAHDQRDVPTQYAWRILDYWWTNRPNSDDYQLRP